MWYHTFLSMIFSLGDQKGGGFRSDYPTTPSTSQYLDDPLFPLLLLCVSLCTVSPWITLRQMEENMVEEVEAAGALFLRAGIVESSRFSWNLATQYYAEKFNYAKLAMVYVNLAKAVVSQVPSVDTSLPQEVSTTLGRFYRVWFHGGAPDDLNGVEFVYRSKCL